MIEPREHEELLCTLQQIERQLRRRAAVNDALNGSCLALAIGVVLMLTGKAFGFASTPLLLAISFATLLVLAGGAAINALSQKQTLARVARICDRQLGLKERVGTALEVISGGLQGSLVEAQVLDAQRQLSAIDIEKAFSIRWPAKPSLAVLVLLAGLTFTSQLQYPLAKAKAPTTAAAPTADSSGSIPGSAGTVEAHAQDRQKEMEVEGQLKGLINDIAGGQVNSTQINDRLYRAEFELRLLLARPDAEIQREAARLAAQLKWIRQSAELSESLTQRDYAAVIPQLRTLDRRLSTLSDDERNAITLILTRSSSAEAGPRPDIATLLQQTSAAIATADRDELSSALRNLSSVLIPEQGQLDPSASGEASGNQSSLLLPETATHGW